MVRRNRIPEGSLSRDTGAGDVRAAAAHPLLQMQQRTGNQLMQRLLQLGPRIEPAGSEREREAQAAERGHAPRSRVSASGRASLGGGAGLPRTVRRGFERQFGRSLDQVRIHSGTEATASADALNARAFAIGNDIVFGKDQYAPGTDAGRRLLGHELAHVAQPDSGGAPTLARQGHDEPTPGQTLGPLLPPLHVAPLGLTFFPGPLRTGVLGARIPLPASLRATNVLDVGSGPTFVLDLNPNRLVATFLSDLELSSSVRAGTPLERARDPSAQQRTTLRNTVLRLDTRTGRITGTATLSVGSEYPPTFHGPTDLDVRIESSPIAVQAASGQPGRLTGSLAYGPLHADFQLRFQYDASRLERAASPVFAPQGGFAGFWDALQGILHRAAPGYQRWEVFGDALRSLVREVLAGRFNGERFARETLALVGSSIPADADLAGLRRALSELAEEFSHPGFHLTGGLGLGPVPLSRFMIDAPTTRPLPRPLPGAPTSFPSTIGAYGTVIAPAGSITSVPVPAFGGLYSRFGERQGFSAIGGLLPSISTEAISAGRPFAAQFPVYAFTEVSYVRRVSNALDLGLRLTAQVSTPEFLGREAEPTDPAARFLQTQAHYIEARDAISSPRLIPPTVGATIFGRFGGPF